MTETMMGAADMKAIMGGDSCGLGGSGIGLLILLLFLTGGAGFGGWGNRGNVATTDEVAAGFNFAGINNKLNEIVAGQAGINQNLSGAICQLGYQDAQHYASLSKELSQCCCESLRASDAVRFDMANYAAATNAHVTEQTQKVLDLLTGNRMADMQAQINQLQLQASLCNVVRYPSATTYATTCNPFFGGYNACGCGTNI